eukprot:TRINITY_DN91_c0_g1_i1.p1 TRINITY_DN91_c0_g1~~TRINITY_DN91_c0_g1_i1.p1  ORF type:complete len:189 (+),score=46.51 TRINITY_DN91_c0_g1_i1:214-780(+)
MVLLRAMVCDRTSGVCLVDVVWKWTGGHPIEGRSAVCNLFLTFLQFSNEIGEGDCVSQAVFSEGILNQTNTRGLGRKAKGKRGGKGAGAYCMRLAMQKNENVIVAVFHEMNDEFASVESMAKEAVNLFQSEHGASAAEMRDIFDSLVDEQRECKTVPSDVLARFEGFGASFTTLRSKYFADQEGQDED